MVAPILLDEAVLVTFGNDEYNIGEKLARLAQQIEHGVKPADLPVETAEIFLTVNLDTADKIGLDLSDEILSQAKKIIR
jgi:putative ABC transport system substrate-binding protein